jgi:class 3 adenylate cyclase
MEPRPSQAELEELGLFDPAAPDAADRSLLLNWAFDLGATLDELVRAHQTRTDSLGALLVDLVLRPPGPTEDLAAFAAGSGLDADLVRRLWLALGLPDSDISPVRVTPDAAVALRFFAGMAPFFGEDATFGVARVLGSSMARLSEALSGAFRMSVEVPSRSAGTSYHEVAGQTTAVVRDRIPPFVDAMAAVFRRHLVNVSYQMWSPDAENAAVTLQRTVCFADLVGSTEALRALSIREMAELVRRFEEQVWDLVSAAGGRVVKLIGDEAMFVLDDPVRACQVGMDLIETSGHPVRIGMTHGTVVGLYGDYYGEVVILAARLVSAAAPSTLVVSQSIRDRVDADFTLESLGPLELKGFADPTPAYRVMPLGKRR